MFEGRRVVAVCPAGRREYLRLLLPQLARFSAVIDEVRLWVNTTCAEDIAFMEAAAATATPPGFIQLERLDIPHKGNWSIHTFFKNCVEPKTIYVRFDDDIVFLDTLERFRGFLRFRLENPQFFLVYANILNNSIITYLHQQTGRIPKDRERGVVSYHCMDDVGWKSPEFAAWLHRDIILPEIAKKNMEGDPLARFHFAEPYILENYEHVSINVISWLGESFAAFGGRVDPDEERWLSCRRPADIGRKNAIYGEFAAVHYAFWPQRPGLEGTGILEAYAAA